ncbi:Putative auto-transporter adhesin, head GIN domain [Polaribacter sp. KT25b]|uniref:head GIN domain-containing protein n=1 Tax=Polaribacter sp. KT25b TaxID=1855336 RepID=UPI00087A23EB|nr:head GIN domain-containing protein [Polaribacter sp. KT25b]SDR78663.1 Putative auto-transporter adhesin, head GIN domain [Polaribacter sp. KT25b]
MKSTTTKFLTLLFTITLFTSCNINMFNRVNGNKNVVTEDRTTKEAFTTIKVSSGLDLFISQGSKNKIIVEADENLQEIIITEVKNGELKIYSEKNIWRAKARKIYVTVKNLETLTATSGAEVYAKESLKVNNLRISATSGAEINISVNANTVETNATSGADIEISGISNKYITNATSGASIDAYELKSKNVIAKVTSGADINLFVSEKLDAKATSGGDIDFKGNPKKVDKKSTSGGSISAE